MRNDIIDVLRFHAHKYPLMRPVDAVKLLYQNEFGGGHLVSDFAQSLRWIEREYAAVVHDDTLPLTVPIGNGIVRVNLAAIDLRTLPLAALNEVFVASSQAVKGSMSIFLNKLMILQELTAQSCFLFDSHELSTYIMDYAANGYPIVSHSDEYRSEYKPSYRIVQLNKLQRYLR